MSDELDFGAAMRALIYEKMSKEDLIAVYEEAEEENLYFENRIEAMTLVIIAAAVAFEHICSDLREGVGSPNFDFQVRDLVQSGPEIVQNLLNVAGQNAVDIAYANISEAYERLRAEARAQENDD